MDQSHPILSYLYTYYHWLPLTTITMDQSNPILSHLYYYYTYCHWLPLPWINLILSNPIFTTTTPTTTTIDNYYYYHSYHILCKNSISLSDYIRRIVKYANIEKSILLLILVYIDRICAAIPIFTISTLTIHRYLDLLLSHLILPSLLFSNTHQIKHLEKIPHHIDYHWYESHIWCLSNKHSLFKGNETLRVSIVTFCCFITICYLLTHIHSLLGWWYRAARTEYVG